MPFSAHRHPSTHSPSNTRASISNASTPTPDPARQTVSPTSNPRSHPTYELCPACGAKVSPRDNQSGNVKSGGIEGHKTNCPSSARLPASHNTGARRMSTPASHASPLSSSFPVSPTTSAVSRNPTRRRAKRTEEERIEYLRSDPHVAKYEAYRVLCAVCDKWIRLRPNSTYCSIPWDAHRKSCLGRKLPQNELAAENLTYVLTNDPHVRKFDAERALCGLCDQWISLPSDDPDEARKAWHGHRSLCAKSHGKEKLDLPGSETEDIGSRRSVQQGRGDMRHSDGLSPVTIPDCIRYPPFPPSPTVYASTTAGSHSAASPSPSDISSTHSRHAEHPYSSQADARKRNADQRLASLQADSLISIVEPNRVFCRICEKWVQLRQDSSYCAYPWIMHRGKCLRRRDRRAAKASEVFDDKYSHSIPSSSKMIPSENHLFPSHPSTSKVVRDSAKSHTNIYDHHSQVYSKYSSPSSSSRRRESPTPPSRNHKSKNKGTTDDPISADEGDYMDDRYASRPENRDMGQKDYRRQSRAYSPKRAEKHFQRPDVGASSYHYSGPDGDRRKSLIRSWDVQANSASDIDMSSNSGDSDYDDELNSPTRKSNFGAVELQTFEGRRSFIRISLSHLFSTSYAGEDKLPIASLVAYLNAAIPEGKYDEFGTGEVARSVARLAEQGLVVWEGDIIRSASAGRRL